MSGLAGQSIGLDEQSPTPIGGPAALDAESRGSMESFIGFGAGATSYDPAPVDFDAADDTVTSAADGTTRYAPEYTDNQLVWGSGTPADGILFDTARGDSFLDFVATPSSGAVITSDSITLDSDTPVSVEVLLNKNGAAVEQCFDILNVEVGFELTGPFGGAAIPGVLFGFKSSVNGWYGIMSQGHGGQGGNVVLPSRYTSGSPTAGGTAGATIDTGIPCTNIIELNTSTFTTTAVNDSVTGIDGSVQLVYTATSFELPRNFNVIGIRFDGGHAKIISMKITTEYPNATYALIGDSITQGRFASTYAESYGQIFRTSTPNDTIVCGAPGALIADWTTQNLDVVFAMKPKYAVVFLGTNDLQFGSEIVAKTDYDILMAKVEAAGVKAIAIGIPPASNPKTPLFNNSLEQTYPRYIDCYTPLLGTGISMNPAYDSGDGLHPNSAGHALIASTIQAAITANGWS